VSASVSGTDVAFHSTTYGDDAFVSVKPINTTWDGLAAGTTAIDNGQDAQVLINGQAASVDGLTAQLRSNGLDVVLELTADRGTNLGSSNFNITGGGATFQIGPEVNPNGQVSIGVPSMATSNLGNAVLGFLSTLKGPAANSLVNGNHDQAEKIVKEAISQVAVIRGRLGGLQRNQIETNINSQRIALENVQAAESAIRDADIAVEVAALTRSQILVQSTTSILGVANQLPQNALALLG
jgi:flagellin